MSKESIIPIFGARNVQLTELNADELVNALWEGQRDFSNRYLVHPRAVESFIDSGTGSINQYTTKNEEDLRRLPIGFQSSILAGLYGPGIKIPFTNFTMADMTGADLSDADLRKAVFVGSYLQNVSFFGSDLTGADFRNARGLESGLDIKDAIYGGIIIKPEQVELFRGFGLDIGKIDVRD